MTVRDELPGTGGENFGPMPDAIAEHLPEILAGNRELAAAGYEFVAPIRAKGETIHFSDDQLESVTPSEENGSFVVRLKGTISEHKKIVGAASIIVTGGALLAAARLIRQRRKT